MRRLTRDHGTLLVIDETHTICAGPGGYTAAYGLDPDLLVVGKPIGGGIPAAAYGLAAPWRDRVRATFDDPSIDVSGIGGTLAGNALSVAAMRAALSTSLRAEDFAVAVPLAQRFTAGVAQASPTPTWPGRCSGSAAAPSTGSAHRRGPALRQLQPGTTSWRRSSTSTRSTGACC